MARLYAVVTVEENEKYCAYAIPFTQEDNVLCKFERVKGLRHANIFTTKKAAREIVEFWNECYKRNGTYMFD